MEGIEKTACEVAELRRLLASREAEIERLRGALRTAAASGAAVVEAAALWRGCCDTIADPIVVMQGRCEVARANQAFAALAGVSVRQLRGLRCDRHRFGELPCPGAEFQGPGESQREAKVGAKSWLLRSFPVEGEGQVVLFKDVTSEREAIRRCLRSEKTISVGRLAGGIAYEINSPLAGILTLAQVMRHEDRPAEDREKLDLIIDAALRSKRVLDSIVRLSQPLRAEDRVPIDLAHVVEDALFILRQKMGAGQELARDLRPAVCLGDRSLLSQLVVHLLLNALDAVNDAGKVAVRTEIVRPGVAALTVSDDGPGVPPEHAGRIFEPFFTTRPGAAGLGLSVCSRIVDEHGGVIHYDAPPGGGARFQVELPAPASGD